MSLQFSARASFAAIVELLETSKEDYVLKVVARPGGSGRILLEHFFTDDSAKAFLSAVKRVWAGSDEACEAEWGVPGANLLGPPVNISWRPGFWCLTLPSGKGVTVSIRAPLFATLVGAVADRFYLDAPEMTK